MKAKMTKKVQLLILVLCCTMVGKLLAQDNPEKEGRLV
jgi:hypothetical protein